MLVNFWSGAILAKFRSSELFPGRMSGGLRHGPGTDRTDCAGVVASLSHLLGPWSPRHALWHDLFPRRSGLHDRLPGRHAQHGGERGFGRQVPHLVAEVTSHDGGEVDYARPRDYVFP